MLREKQFSERRLKDFVDALDREAVSRCYYLSVFLSVIIPGSSLSVNMSVNLSVIVCPFSKRLINVDLCCPILDQSELIASYRIIHDPKTLSLTTSGNIK